MSLIQELDHMKIPLKGIKAATGNFAYDNFLGVGGFGRVYKGKLPLSASGRGSKVHDTTVAVKRGFGTVFKGKLPLSPSASGSEERHTTVAVKRLDVKGGQGEHEFLTEIAMLASYKHDNLVSLVGFSDEKGEKIIVYKYEVRGSLDKYLASKDLTWEQRLQICLGAARGLDYLHSGVGVGHRVIHRDIKSSNILLDENWEAKISDFGLSKIGPANQEFTFLVTKACGTFGYADPSYTATGILTKECDVYSFGVVLFEVLCGRLAIIRKYHDERQFLSRLVELRYEEKRLDEIILPSLREQMEPNSFQKFFRIACQCLKTDRKQRPTMGLIVEELQMALEFQRGFTRIGLWGSSKGGSPWSFQLESNHKLRKITINHGDWIYFISFTTEDLSGCLHSSQKYGSNGGCSGGKTSEINFDADEEIIGILGTTSVTTERYEVLTSLGFLTTKKMHEPFGKKNGKYFVVRWDVGSFAGFYGRGGLYLDGFGWYSRVGPSKGTKWFSKGTSWYYVRLYALKGKARSTSKSST